MNDDNLTSQKECVNTPAAPSAPAPAAPEKPLSYSLTPPERGIMQALNQAALNAKGRIFDLQAELEQARQQLGSAQQAFSGALTVLANAHGMADAQLSNDMATITPRQPQQ
jgi:hypothetical protein